ncbi:MAG: alpha/beta fold hydrolase, partial [Pseudomonadota bacterium]
CICRTRLPDAWSRRNALTYALQDFGSYTVGGRWIDVDGQPTQTIQFTPTASFEYDPNGRYGIAHAYVQYFKPIKRNDRPPIVLLHGGGMSGAMWETTPDSRPGWLQLLVGAGYEVHVVDNVERGRAGWCAVEGIWPDQALLRTAQEAWHLFRIGARETFSERLGFTGCRFPIGSFDTFVRSFVPRWTSTTAEATLAFSQVLHKLGRSIVICHSQGGQIAFEAAVKNSERVSAIVGVEPSGFASEPVAIKDIPVLLVYGDYLEATPGLPPLLEMGKTWSETFTNAGGQADMMQLPETGVAGNTHMLMMDDNSADVLKRVTSWIEQLE